MGKASHLKPIHTGGTARIRTRGKPARELTNTLDLRWPRDWKSDSHAPGANWPHTSIFRGREQPRSLGDGTDAPDAADADAGYLAEHRSG
jgi:hypothetical protein